MTKPAILAFTFSVLTLTMFTAQAVEDQKFMDKAALGGLAEVELGKLASERAANPEVKELAQTIVQDHEKSNDQLKQIAQSKGAKLPQELDRAHKRERDRLSKLTGAEFDRAYVQTMLKEHDKDIKEFQNQAQKGKDPDLKKFATDNVPVLKQHRQRAQELQAKVGGGKGGAGPAGGASNSESRPNEPSR